MARDYEQQHIRYERGCIIDYGYIAFTTTGLTVELTTPLSRIEYYHLQVIQTTPVLEKLFINETVAANGYIDCSSLSSVTITRELDHVLLGGVGSTDYITSNMYVEVPIGCCPYAGTLVEAWFYNHVLGGGAPTINIGKVPTNGAGTADPNYFLTDTEDVSCPASSVGIAITTFAAADVAEDDLLTFGTTSGASSDPSGGWMQAKVLPTPASGLKIYYELVGRD